MATALNEIYRRHNLLGYRSFGCGQPFGVLSRYYGREAGVELREDINTVLQPGMVISMELMVAIPEGLPGAGCYRELDIFGHRRERREKHNRVPFGPEHDILKAGHGPHLAGRSPERHCPLGGPTFRQALPSNRIVTQQEQVDR